jgi:hypothetical protein
MEDIMKSGSYALLAAVLIAVVFGSVFVACFYPSDSPEEEYSVTGVVTGSSSYNQPKLDVRADDIFGHGIALGSLFDIHAGDRVYEDAILLENYLGTFMFDKFVNVESDGYVSIGCVGKLISVPVGSEVTLTYSGTSERYQKTPMYNAGSTDVRGDYASDEEFANFYEVTGGDLKQGVLYRSFSPLYAPNKQTRSAYVDDLAEEAGIEYLASLSYSDASVKAAVESLEGYCVELCKEGAYVAPSMGYLYFQEKEKTVSVLKGIMDNDGPYLVHCNVGRDRTGFMVLLLQSLCGCSVDEMKECESKAFCNLYHIDVGSQEYQTVVDCTYDRNMFLIANPDRIPDMFDIDWDHIDVGSVDPYSAAYSYCTGYLGLTDDEVMKVRGNLCS